VFSKLSEKANFRIRSFVNVWPIYFAFSTAKEHILLLYDIHLHTYQVFYSYLFIRIAIYIYIYVYIYIFFLIVLLWTRGNRASSFPPLCQWIYTKKLPPSVLLSSSWASLYIECAYFAMHENVICGIYARFLGCTHTHTDIFHLFYPFMWCCFIYFVLNVRVWPRWCDGVAIILMHHRCCEWALSSLVSSCTI